MALPAPQSEATCLVVTDRRNPLINEYIVRMIFDYSKPSVKQLCQFRLVCKSWNTVACERLRKKRAFGKLSSQDDVRNFTNMMTLSKDDPYQKFFFNITCTNQYIKKRIFNKFGQNIGKYLTSLMVNTPQFPQMFRKLISASMPHLEDLTLKQIGRISQKVVNEISLLEFPKLKSLKMISVTNETAQIMCNIVDKSPMLTKLEVDVNHCYSWILPRANLTNLTTFKAIEHLPNRHCKYLRSCAVVALTKACPNLKELSVRIDCSTPPKAVNDLLNSLANTLEILKLNIEWDIRCNGLHIDEERLAEMSLLPCVPNFPLMLKLKQLDLTMVPLGSVDFLLRMPELLSLEMDLTSVLVLTGMVHFIPGKLVETQHDKLTKLNLKTFNTFNIDEDIVGTFGRAFPNLIDLEICVTGDTALRALFATMPKLKYLDLDHNDVFITDSGITGIDHPDLLRLTAGNADDVEALRRHPFIGDLSGLQYFCFQQPTLSNASVKYGFIELKELTTLEIMPHLPENRGRIAVGEPVLLKPLADNLKALIRLEIYRDFRFCINRKLCFNNPNYMPKVEDARIIFLCNPATEEDVIYIQEKLPRLKLIFSNDFSPE